MALFSKSRSCAARVGPAQVRSWLARGSGQRLMQHERQLLQQQLHKSFGSYALFYNTLDEQCYATATRHQIRLGSPEAGAEVLCDESHWPIQPDSVDVVILQHSLEFSGSPHELLREALQAVRPGGHIIILGTSPCSFFGLGRWFGRGPWRKAHSLSARRVSEWLVLLGFHVEDSRFFGYRPLFLMQDNGKTGCVDGYLDKKQWPLGNCYMLVARKMMRGSFLQKKKAPSFKQLMPVPAASASPASRNGRLDRKKKYNDRQG